MLKNILGLAVVLAMSLPWHTPAAAQQQKFVESAWTNQQGSTLHIENIDSEGKITGHYINRESGYGCQDTPYPVTGWVLGNNISFTVRWENTVENCQSLTAWTGYLGTDKIHTRWNLVYGNQSMKGTDVFSSSQQTISPSLLPSGSAPPKP